MHDVTVEQILSWPVVDGWRVSPLGDRVKLGNRVTLGNRVKLGDRVMLGNGVMLGNRVTLGDDVTLGDRVKLGNGVTSDTLNKERIAAYRAAGETHVFTKWVTRERRSPRFHGGDAASYPVGAIVEEPDAVESDQQCAAGLHVFVLGFRPEWAGYIGVNHDLIPITVKVRSEDILFAGVADMCNKLRVRRLEVLT